MTNKAGLLQFFKTVSEYDWLIREFYFITKKNLNFITPTINFIYNYHLFISLMWV